MSVLDDLVQAVDTYAQDHVELEVIDVDIPGDVINEAEVVPFSVRIVNHGPLDVTNLTVKVAGRHGATVRSAIFLPFGPNFTTTTPTTVDAHGGTRDLSRFALQAPAQAQDSASLVNVTIETYDVDPAHIYLAHSDGGELPKGTFSAAVERL